MVSYLCIANMLSMVVLSKYFCDASSLTAPRSSVAVIGDRVELRCSVDGNQSVIWGFTSFNASIETDFYFGDDISSPFKSRYKIEKNIRGQHNLIIESVDLDHAGRYQCVIIITGHKSVAHLTVLGSSPNCSASTISADEGMLDKGYLRMNCIVVYTGNMIPIFTWTEESIEDAMAANTSTSDSGNRTVLMTTTSSVIRPLHPDDNGVAFKCKITFQLLNNSQENAPDYKYTWNHTVYGPRNISIVRYGDRLECSADGNPTPIYRWTHVETNAVTDGNILKLNRTYMYDKNSTFQCTATNSISNATESFTIEGFPSDSESSESSLRTIVAAAVGGASFLLLLIIITVSCFINRKKHRGFTRTPAPSFGQTVIDEPDIIDVDIYSHGSNAFRQSENHREVSEHLVVYTDVKKGNVSLINNSCAAYSRGDDNFPSPQDPMQKKKKQNRVGADGTVYEDLSEVKKPFKISRAAIPRVPCETNYAFIDHTARIPPPPPPPPEF